MTIFIENFKNTFFNIDLYELILKKASSILLIIVLTFIGLKISLKIVDYVMKTHLKANSSFGIETDIKRSDTIHKLFRSITRYAIYFIAFTQFLSVFGVNTTGLLASAGLISVAVGFGAQSLVKDIITGFFLILEKQFDVGDYVKISNQAAFIAEGIVMSLGLRSTKIMADSGEVYFIPNSSINQVVNFSKTFNLAKVEFPILVTETLGKLEGEILSLLTELNNNEDYKKYFYKKELLKISSVNKIENNIAVFEIIVKTKLSKSNKIETLLRKDFYNKFTEKIRES